LKTHIASLVEGHPTVRFRWIGGLGLLGEEGHLIKKQKTMEFVSKALLSDELRSTLSAKQQEILLKAENLENPYNR
jgi:hypothetical protein